MIPYYGQGILSKIKICTEALGNSVSGVGKIYNFPLTDILYDICKLALGTIKDDIFNVLQMKINKYRLLHPEFDYSIEDLVKLGWVEYIYGIPEIVVHRTITKGKRGKTYIDKYSEGNILRFIQWNDSLSNDEEFIYIKRTEVNKILKRWKKACANVPKIEWFENESIFGSNGRRLYINEMPHCGTNVDQVMARLWNEICENGYSETHYRKWVYLCYKIAASGRILDYVENTPDKDYKFTLIYRLLDDIEKQREYVNKKIETVKQFNVLRTTQLEKYANIAGCSLAEQILIGNKVFDDLNPRIFGETHYFYYRKTSSDYFCLGTLLENIPYIKNSNVYSIIREYDESGRIKELENSISAETIYYLLDNKETFYLGFKLLLRKAPNFIRNSKEYVGYIWEVLENKLQKKTNLLEIQETRDMFDILLFLIENDKTLLLWKNRERPYYSLFIKLLEYYTSEAVKDKLEKGIKEYFDELMSFDLSDVSWCNCFRLLAYYTTYTIKADRNTETDILKYLIKKTGEGLLKLFSVEKEYCTHIFLDSFNDELCSKIYLSEFSTLNVADLEEYFGIREKDIQKNAFSYRFKACLTFFNRVYSKTKETIIRVILGDLITTGVCKTKIIGYSTIELYQLENLLREALTNINDDLKASELLLDRICKLGIYELVAFIDIYDNEDQKNTLIKRLEERVASEKDEKRIFSGLHSEHVIDIVQNQRIKCLYPYVDKYLEKKIVLLKAKLNNSIAGTYEQAINQKLRMAYIQNRREEIEKTGDMFFTAIYKTEDIKNVDDYNIAIIAWKKIIEDKQDEIYRFSAANNFLVAVFNMITIIKAISGKKDELKQRLEEDIEWLLRHIIKAGYEKWDEYHQEQFIKHILEAKKELSDNWIDVINDLQNDKLLQIDITHFLPSIMNEINVKNQVDIGISDKTNEENISECLSEFFKISLRRRTEIYANAKRLKITNNEVNWEGFFLLKTVLRSCRLLRNTVPYLVLGYPKSKENGKRLNIPEDNVSILFRETYNMAYKEMFDVSVSDQQKSSTTGKKYKRNGLDIPAEIDMSVEIDNNWYELMEAFILDGKSENVYADHLAKVIGNNNLFHSPCFMLIYSFEEDTSKRHKWWKKYVEYVKKWEYKGKEEVEIIKSSVVDVESSSCFHPDLKKYNEFKIIRQIVNIDEHEFEIFHIRVDLRNAEAELLRKK